MAASSDYIFEILSSLDLVGEASVELLRRREAERVADLLLSAGLGLPRFHLLQ